MSDVALQFVLGSSWSSRLIAWYGQGYSGFSHVDAVVPEGLIGARSDNIGGKPPGVQLRPANYERWKRRRLVIFRDKASLYPLWRRWLDNQIGFGYDKGDILGLILGVPLMQPGHWICSACQTGALESTRILPSSPVPPQQVTPNTLFSMCIAAGASWQDLPTPP